MRAPSAELPLAIYAALAEHTGAKLAGDKSPNDLIFLRMLIKVGGIAPTAKIIHIVRDVRDVIFSIRNANMTNAPEDWFPRIWSTSNLYLWDLFHQSEQYLLVRYEEYVRSPELVVRNLCTHLGIGYQSFMLDPERRHPRYRTNPNHNKLYQPISDLFIGAYRADLPEPIVTACEKNAAEAMRVFGY